MGEREADFESKVTRGVTLDIIVLFARKSCVISDTHSDMRRLGIIRRAYAKHRLRGG